MILKRHYSKTKGIAAAILLSLVACNKDEVIIDNGDHNNVAGYNPPKETSSAYVDKVYEWTPAPGQYINDFGTAFANPEEVTSAEAASWALERMKSHRFVSLGAFGGYIVVGFDHSIANTGGYEIGVMGNAFISAAGASDEPGIVYVMQDENGNGLPDDKWYELKGSDTFAAGTIRNYEVTYYKPDGDGENVRWTDNLGNSGEIKYMGSFHVQSTYYPYWVTSESYTVCGTCLEAKTIQNPETGNWENLPFDWGYADNMGEDNIEYDGVSNCNRFKISDAIDNTGKEVKLDYIDFVKIQTGVSSESGWLGEVSTEVLGIVDLTLGL